MKLARINSLLMVAIVLINLYIIGAPFVPMLLFWADAHATSRVQRLDDALHLPLGTIAYRPRDNRIVIPAMALDAAINEGSDLRALRAGTWRRPNGSTPDRGGNTVVVGHRFTYTNPRGTFYYLNKLQAGDEIGVFWQGKRYLYRVVGTTIVPPTDVAVEAPTPDARLTLYTCTPLWLPKDRLVVTAELEGAS